MKREQFTNLSQFLGAYFHPEWYLEYEDTKTVIQEFLTSETPKTIDETIRELKQLIKMNLSETELRNLLAYELGCYYDPSFYNSSYQEWLSWLQINLKQTIMA